MANRNSTTLRQVLTQQKPLLPCTSTSNRNTTHGSWPKLDEYVVIWDEFNLKTLNESYGHLLDVAVPDTLLASPQADEVLAGLVVHTAEDINHLISWNYGLMEPTLRFAKSRLGLHPGLALYQKYSTPDKSLMVSLPGAAGRLTVNHIVALDDFPGGHLVVGLGRMSSKWSGRTVVHQLNSSTSVKKELIWPLRQLGNICKAAQTRYGYIQTDEELVVCCFSKIAQDEWKVALMPVPWTRSGADVLTTDLALWWLCMLAMSAQCHREIVDDGEMVKIDKWDEAYLDERRGWGRIHRYSGFEKPTNPRPASAGNVAATVVYSGVHVDPLFGINPTAVDRRADVFGHGTVNPSAVNLNAVNPTAVNFDAVNPGAVNFDAVNFVNFDTVNYDAVSHDAVNYDAVNFDAVNFDSATNFSTVNPRAVNQNAGARTRLVPDER
ncbi:hypothetical protein H634G_08158 [Metarhizium anisopliae BRIP 53293]|uniref:Uncharacterized protein n=1 Tax=Metarhizium anisopliae BRIP 53293 TaxID=1291518 RepID=A0A0D9NVJ2_METAN|nr:hypothetical protein H634G_08158 [Metarhizium anisopliae BRIP 53293]